MSRVKCKDTTPELIIRSELWKRGLRYRINVKQLPGRPDIVFFRAKVAIFIDGAFWHGKKLSQDRLKLMSEYWRKKIQRNVARDIQVENNLKTMGYEVMRFLDTEVLRESVYIADIIERIVRKRLGRD
jgi:DNA mismatch endonuclease (patch repair protein)